MRTAVIAVHGVGSPPRHETARSVADLLVQHVHDDATYDGFCETCLTIPTAPLDGRSDSGTGSGQADTTERPSLRIGARDRTTFTAIHGIFEPPDVAFMRGQLANYESPRVPYDTIELTGTRVAGGSGPAGSAERVDVHVYEMYWADLSRLGNGLVRVLGAVFQLIQHVCHLGRKALDVAAEVAKENDDPSEAAAWSRYATAYNYIVRLFTIYIPVCTMLMLSFVPLFAPAAVPEPHRLLAGLVAAELLVLVGAGLLFFTRVQRERSASEFVWVMIAAVAAGIALYARGGGGMPVLGTILLALVLGLGALGAFVAILRKYDRTRNGAFTRGIALLAAVLALTAWSSVELLRAPDLAEGIRGVAFLGFQWSYVALVTSWTALWIATVAAFVVYMARVLPMVRARGRADLARAKRAAWTARVTLAGSVFSFVVLSLVLYGALVALAAEAHGRFDLFPHVAQGSTVPMVLRLVPPDFACPTVPAGQAYDPSACTIAFFRELVAEGGTSGLEVAFIGAGAALVLVSWFVVLIAYTSLRDLGASEGVPLGNWITSGFVWLRRAGTLFAVFTLGAIIAGALLDIVTIRQGQIPPAVRALFNRDATQRILGALAVAVVASAATFAALRVRLEGIAAKARPALGILLDIDNYLRESGTNGTPRARIAERFTSVLRYVANRREIVNGVSVPYFDRIVIVSHSQGTVISADLLRFLHVTDMERELIDGRFHLLTMGSPLRQLYAHNFPHLYRWIDVSDDGAAAADDDATARRALSRVADAASHGEITGRSPSPLWLGVAEWVNLFTTGDYIGRTLWRAEVPATWERQDASRASVGFRRRERCLGAGTHTHYWTSADVAAEIDRLIGGEVATPPPALPRTSGASVPGGT